MSGPTLIQKRVLAYLINDITNKHPKKWGNWLWDDFEEWGINQDLDISMNEQEVISVFDDFPAYPKSVLTQSILNGWNVHHDMASLKDSIITLARLHACGTSEYFLLQYIYNCIKYFGDLCENIEFIHINMMNDVYSYTLRFGKSYSKCGDSHGIIDLQMNKTEEEPRVAVVPWNRLLSERFTIPEDCIQQDSNIEYISNELETIFRDEFLEYSLPKRPYSNYSYSICKEQLGRGILYLFHNLTLILN